MTKKVVYEIKSCNLTWLAEAIINHGGGVPCVQVVAQMEDQDAAIAKAEKLAAENPDWELLEVRKYPGDICVWSTS